MIKIKKSESQHLQIALSLTFLCVFFTISVANSSMKRQAYLHVDNREIHHNTILSTNILGIDTANGNKKSRVEVVTYDSNTKLIGKDVKNRTLTIKNVTGKNNFVTTETVISHGSITSKSGGNNLQQSLEIDLPEDALYVINGKVDNNGKQSFNKLDVSNIKSITILNLSNTSKKNSYTVKFNGGGSIDTKVFSK